MDKKTNALVIALCLCLSFSFTSLAKTTITYQYNWYAVTTPGYNEAFQLLIDTFNRSQDEIFVDGYVVQGTDQRLLTAIAGGVQADVVHFESSSVIEWVARGLIEPIDDVLSVDYVQRQLLPRGSG